MELTALISELLEKNQPLVCYRLPGALQPVCLAGGTFSRVTDPSALPSAEGFIIAPFHPSPENHTLLYEGGKKLVGWNPVIPALVSESRFNPPPKHPEPNKCIDFEEYNTQANHMVNMLRDGVLKKVVLSRVIDQPLPDGFQPARFFQSLCQEYPKAFVYLFNDGEGQVWTGATPEVLLEVNQGQGQTMSLAATLPARKGGNWEPEWQNKEKEEQFLVTQFIRDKLITSGIMDFIEEELETRQAGPVMHLLKRFRFEIPANYPPLKLAQALHPTPAVCGLPRREALEEILRVESHDRAFYSGFLGPVSNKDASLLFVNLRCMQIIEKNAFIFVGGGLLAESDIEREWQETVLKAETLLSVIRKFN